MAAALYWFHRHQESAGNWSLSQFARHCKEHPCSGQSDLRQTPAPPPWPSCTYLAAGQTHKTPGPYRDTIQRGLFWLIKRQTPEGNLAVGAEQPMYAHGLATIALCEAYGMSKDPHIGNAAPGGRGLHRAGAEPRDRRLALSSQESGDTSVFGWQVMALKSAQMAGLAVNSLEPGKLPALAAIGRQGRPPADCSPTSTTASPAPP